MIVRKDNLMVIVTNIEIRNKSKIFKESMYCMYTIVLNDMIEVPVKVGKIDGNEIELLNTLNYIKSLHPIGVLAFLVFSTKELDVSEIEKPIEQVLFEYISRSLAAVGLQVNFTNKF